MIIYFYEYEPKIMSLNKIRTVFNSVATRSAGNFIENVSKSVDDDVYMVQKLRILYPSNSIELVSVEFISREKFYETMKIDEVPYSHK